MECINYLLKDKRNLVHSKHRSVGNFFMNLIAALGFYCFYDNKPEAIQEYTIEDAFSAIIVHSQPFGSLNLTLKKSHNWTCRNLI